jgi:hypothetical protein
MIRNAAAAFRCVAVFSPSSLISCLPYIHSDAHRFNVEKNVAMHTVQ